MKREERALTFIVLNGINEKVDVTMIYEKGYSTKGEGRGLGLGIVNDIVSKYKNVILNTCADDSKFRQELIINLEHVRKENKLCSEKMKSSGIKHPELCSCP